MLVVLIFAVHVVDAERKGGASFALVRRHKAFSLDLVYNEGNTLVSSLYQIFADQLGKSVVVRGRHYSILADQ
jgi:hypothetical protein